MAMSRRTSVRGASTSTAAAMAAFVLAAASVAATRSVNLVFSRTWFRASEPEARKAEAVLNPAARSVKGWTDAFGRCRRGGQCRAGRRLSHRAGVRESVGILFVGYVETVSTRCLRVHARWKKGGGTLLFRKHGNSQKETFQKSVPVLLSHWALQFAIFTVEHLVEDRS